MENHIFDLAEEFYDMALNYAIKSGNGKHIEKAYYYKAVLLEKKGKSEEAEMYMNLSLDALLKHGSKSEKLTDTLMWLICTINLRGKGSS